ncbi:MAG: hypothetical protein K0S92_1004 [Desertimonas sp.]|nr:hypothetical protein [Desertimonas sp.]
MKAPSSRVAMLLSIAGVLAAGSAAALVNTQVLDDQSGGAPATATVAPTTLPVFPTTTTSPATTPATVPPTSATTPPTSASTPLAAAPTSSTTPTAAATTASTAAATQVGTTQATYRLGDAGTALLDTAGGQLTIVTVTPAPGWFVERAENDGVSVEIRLESASGEVRFDATLVRGVVRVSLDSDDDNSGSGSGGDDDSSGSGGGDDDNSGPGGGGGGDDNSGPGGGDD